MSVAAYALVGLIARQDDAYRLRSLDVYTPVMDLMAGCVMQHAMLASSQTSGMPYFFRNASTRPVVSTLLCWPVKNGWQLAHTATRMRGTVERVCTVAPQVHVISVSMDTGWCAIFIGPPLTAVFSAHHVRYPAADTSAQSFSAKTCLGTTPTV
jgi:hypothetical protein